MEYLTIDQVIDLAIKTQMEQINSIWSGVTFFDGRYEEKCKIDNCVINHNKNIFLKIKSEKFRIQYIAPDGVMYYYEKGAFTNLVMPT